MMREFEWTVWSVGEGAGEGEGKEPSGYGEEAITRSVGAGVRL
jgi:hypothetical protein